MELHRNLRHYFSQRSDNPENWVQNRSMIGNSSVARADLADLGVTFNSSFVTNMLGNPVGGQARGFAYAGSYGFSLNINFNQTGWTGLNLFSSAVWRTGTNLSQRKINNQFTVAQVYGSQTVKLNELYLYQSLLSGSLEFKLGRLDAGNDFFTSPLYWRFVNNGFDGNPVSIFFNVPFTAYPNSTWGAYLMFKPYKRISAKFAVYNANSKIKKNKYHGINFTFKSTNGVIWIAEWCGLVNQEKGDHGMPGNYKLGYFYLTGSEPKFTGGSERGDPCYYLLFDQMIYRKGGPDSTRGITPFVCFIYAPPNRNLFPYFTNFGLVWKGIFDQRPEDALDIGFIYGSYSSKLQEVERKKGVKPQDFEAVIELNYWIQINNWFYIAPDMQYIIRPKGMSSIPNAYVVGAQIGFNIF